MRPYFSQAWTKYVDAGNNLQRGNPDCEVVTLVHELGRITRSKPLSLLGASDNLVATETGQSEGAGEAGASQVEEIQEHQVVEIQKQEDDDEVEFELADVVKESMLKIEMVKQQSEDRPKRKKKRKRRRKKKTNKMNILDFLKNDTAKVDAEVVEKKEAQKPKKKRKRRRRKKNKVIDLSKEANTTMKEFEERAKFEEAISVKKNFVMKTAARKQYEGSAGVKAWSGGSGYGSQVTGDTQAWDINTWLSGEDGRQTQIREKLAAITQILTDDELMLEFVTQSPLMKVLSDYCENDSLNDIESKSKLYTEVFECVARMMSMPAYLPLLNKKIGRASIAQYTRVLAGKFRKRLALEKSDEENPLAILIMSISDELNKEEEELEAQTQPVNTQSDASSEDYCQIMRELCFDSIETMEEFPGHKYKSTKVAMKRKLMKRLAAEFADLGVSLPIHEESSVFFRFCDESMSHAQMLIIASEGTPYSSGCFIFDVCFPANYPDGPPKVNLQTTGRGAVRFNPNLYNCGKVCLSLLGTWGGQSQGEKWNPKLSSFLQVAISIQSLIFVPEPYYNEPGWESYMGTAEGDKRSKNYNKVIEKGTVNYAIVEMLENPPAAWKDVINNHFRMQADRVLSNVARWMGEEAAVTLKVEGLLRELREKAYSTGA